MIVESQDGYALECRGVTYRLPSGPALVSGLHLTVARGETLVLLGRSGSGKTTTLKLINRLLEPSEGEIFISGRAVSAWDPIQLRRGIGYVIQDAGLFPHWSVEKNVALVPQLEHWAEDRIRTRVKRCWSWSAFPLLSSPRGARLNFRAAKGSAWGWRGRWRQTLRSC